MRSLSEHLRQPDRHGLLPFHPDCPVCRGERLHGPLPADTIVSARTQALLAAGLLALSSAGPGVALAAEPDQEQDGTSPPGQTDNPGPALSPDFDPGGDSTDLPADASPVPQVQAPADPGNQDTAPLDAAPTTDADAPVVDPGDGPAPATSQQQPAPPASQAPTPAPTPEPAVPADTTPAPAPAPGESTPAPTPSPAPAAAPTTPASAAPPARRAEKKRAGTHHRHTRHSSSHVVDREQFVATPAPVHNAELNQASAAPSSPVVSVPAAARAKPRDRTHVVVRGESLWSVASDVLGPGASVAAIARKVDRLWELNKERIGTGDPDLVMVGTRLALR